MDDVDAAASRGRVWTTGRYERHASSALAPRKPLRFNESGLRTFSQVPGFGTRIGGRGQLCRHSGARCEPDDYLVFCYSGHGDSVDNAAAPSGKDCMLCLRTRDGKDEQMLDDELAKLLVMSLNPKVRVLVLVFVFVCALVFALVTALARAWARTWTRTWTRALAVHVHGHGSWDMAGMAVGWVDDVHDESDEDAGGATATRGDE